MDNQEDNASLGASSQDSSGLPAVPMPPQDRQTLLSRAAADLAPALKTAADSVNNTADAQVWTSLANIEIVHCCFAPRNQTHAAQCLCLPKYASRHLQFACLFEIQLVAKHYISAVVTVTKDRLCNSCAPEPCSCPVAFCRMPRSLYRLLLRLSACA